MVRLCAWHKQNFPEELDSNGQYILGYIGNEEGQTDGICERCKQIALLK